MKIAIIGAGAAGCFCSIELKRRLPQAEVHVFEKATKPLAKVAITGGGRCNLTNSFRNYLDDRGCYTQLQQVYPRGDKLMRKLLNTFSHEDAMNWFEQEGVRLVTQDDQCVFPASQNAMEIVDTLTHQMHNLGILLHLNHRIEDITMLMDEYDRVVVTTGGLPRSESYAFMAKLTDLQIVPPVPSLFTFNINGEQNSRLMGTVVQNVTASLVGVRQKATGPLLWTHWGVSGPAILKLSSYGANVLAKGDYKGVLQINWLGDTSEREALDYLTELMSSNTAKTITNIYPNVLTQKHWIELLNECHIPLTQRCGALNSIHLARLSRILTGQQLYITGRCHYKEEFVTCGGVSLTEISAKTLESKHYPGLFFAGETLDIDAITGGFNLQAAWTTAYTVAQSISNS